MTEEERKPLVDDEGRELDQSRRHEGCDDPEATGGGRRRKRRRRRKR